MWREYTILRSETDKRQYWISLAILALPFLAGYCALRGLKLQFASTGSSDEFTYHYLTIKQFMSLWPDLDFVHYNSATPPLYHTVMAGIGKLIGGEIQVMRTVNLLISFATVVVFYRLLVNQLRLPVGAARIYSLMFAVSPYFLAPSFVLMTDNFGLLLGLSAITLSLRIRSAPSTPLLVWLTVLIALACITRQTYVWLIPFALLCLYSSVATMPFKVIGSISCCLAALPLTFFVLAWGGLVPPRFAQTHQSSAGFSLAPLYFLMSLIAIYSVIALPEFRKRIVENKLPVVVSIAITLGLLFLFPITGLNSAGDGYLWFFSDNIQTIGSVPFIFLLLAPLGAAFFVCFRPSDEIDWAPLAVSMLVVLTSLPNKVAHQRYLDPIAPLVVLMAASSIGEFRRRPAWGGVILMAMFLLYAVARHLLT